MKYKEYMDNCKLTEQEKNDIYNSVTERAEKSKKKKRIGKFAFAFSGAVILLIAAVGAGLFFVKGGKDEGASYVLAFSGGYDESRIPFETSEFGEDGEIDVKIESYNALRSFAEEKKMPFFNESDANYDSSLSKKVREYGEKFFEKNSLVVVIKLEREYDLEKFRDMEINGEVLTVNLSKPETDMSYTEISAFVYIIETGKTFVSNVSEIKTIVKSEGKWSDYSGVTYFGAIQTDDESRDAEELVRQGIITRENLDEIYVKSGCRYIDGEWKQTRMPSITEADPELLSEEIKFKIIQSFMDELFENAYKEAERQGNEKMMETLKKMEIYKYKFLSVDRYYGTYNGCVAVGIEYNVSMLNTGIFLVVWRPL